MRPLRGLHAPWLAGHCGKFWNLQGQLVLEQDVGAMTTSSTMPFVAQAADWQYSTAEMPGPDSRTMEIMEQKMTSKAGFKG